MLGTLNLRAMDVASNEWPTFLSLLTLADLPVPDRTEAGRFFVVEDEVGLVGFGGVEGAGPDQILRSVVVTPGVRRRGMGPVVVQRLVEQARNGGAERLWLLTTDADQFFAALGWTEVPRDRAPEAVRVSRLYCEICPATAALMVRPLAQWRRSASASPAAFEADGSPPCRFTTVGPTAATQIAPPSGEDDKA